MKCSSLKIFPRTHHLAHSSVKGERCCISVCWERGVLSEMERQEDFERYLQRSLAGEAEKVTIRGKIQLPHTVVIKSKHRHFLIEGEEGLGMVEIEGNGHCLFQITGKGCCLTLKNLKLNHLTFEKDKRNIGGAIFILGTSKVILDNCQVSSSHGFGVWGVQNAQCLLVNCHVSSLERSGCVFFGKSSLNIESSRVSHCGQHGICVRGSVRLAISNSLITHCRVRGVYGYDKSQITIHNTIISFTQSTDHSAVDFWGGVSAPSQHPTLNTPHLPEKCLPEKRFRRSSSPARDLMVTLDGVIFLHNNCSSVRCRDQVKYEVLNCFYYSPHFDLCVPLSSDSYHIPPPLSSFRYDHHGRTVLWFLEEDDQVGHSQNNSKLFLELFVDTTSDQEELLPSPSCILWEYLHDDTQWRVYDRQVHGFLSSQYAAYLSSKDINSDEGKDQKRLISLPEPYEHYQIDFQKFEQINTNTFFTRPIRWQSLESNFGR